MHALSMSVVRHVVFCCVQIMARQQGSVFFLQGEDVFYASGTKKSNFLYAALKKHTTALLKFKAGLKFKEEMI